MQYGYVCNIHIARARYNIGVQVAFQLAPMKQLTLIQLQTQPPCECPSTGQGSKCTLVIRAAGCTLTFGAGSQVHPNGWGRWMHLNGWGSLAWPGWGRRCAWVLPSWLTYVLVAWALQDTKQAGKLKCDIYFILRCNMHITRGICILHKYPYYI